MASNDPEALIYLIYRHLKKNGHKKAANVLKKHAPQFEPSNVKVSLKKIFKKWHRIESKKKNNERGASQGKCAGKKPSVTKGSVAKQKRSRDAGQNIISRKKDKLQTKTVAGNRNRKRTSTEEPKKTKTSTEGQKTVPKHTSLSSREEDDSDSDSSLDMEKWKRLALKLSDADMAKMDVLTNPSTTTANCVEKSSKKRKPAQSKKDESKNTKAKPSARKSKAKAEKPLKSLLKNMNSISVPEKFKPPSKKKKVSILEPKEVAVPVIEMTCRLTEQAVIPKTGGLSENDTVRTPVKKIQRKKKESKNIESPTKSAGAQKLDNLSKRQTPYKKAKCKVKSPEPAGVDTVAGSIISTSVESKRTDCLPAETPGKKHKSKKSVKPPEPDVNTSPKEADTEFASSIYDGLSESKLVKTFCRKSKLKKCLESPEPVERNTPPNENDPEIDQGHLIFDQPQKTKRIKEKKAKGHTKSVDVNIPPEEGQAEDVNDHSKLLVSVVKPDLGLKPSKNVKAKKTDIISELNRTETPLKVKDCVANAHSEAEHSPPPSKRSKHHIVDSHTGALVLDTSSKKSKKKKCREADEAESVSQKACLDVGGVDETICSSRKSKSKKSKNIKTNGTTDSGLLTNQEITVEEISSLSTKYQEREEKRSKDEEKVLAAEDDLAETKKKKKKESEEIVVVEVPPVAQSEELGDTLANSREKKKKKKKKDRDKENPLPSCPSAEEEPPKKKKKSSKEKDCVNDVTQDGHI